VAGLRDRVEAGAGLTSWPELAGWTTVTFRALLGDIGDEPWLPVLGLVTAALNGREDASHLSGRTSRRLVFSSLAGTPTVDCATKTSGDVDVCSVVIRPGADCPAVLGQRLKSFKAGALSVRRLEDHRDHDGIAAAMPFKSPVKFDSANEFGSEESGCDEQEDDVGFI